MPDSAFLEAFELIATANADLYEILWLSVQVSITALLVSVILGFPLGTTLAISDFRGKACVYHRAQRPDGATPCGRRAPGLSRFITNWAIRSFRPSIHANSDGHCTGCPYYTHHRRTHLSSHG
jgi:hypothetical protein